MAQTKKSKKRTPPKTKPTPEQQSDKTEVTQQARITIELNGDTYVAEIQLWKELKSDGKATS